MQAHDIAAIVNVINLYPIAVDSLQWHLFDDVFTQDVHIDFGEPAIWTGLAPLKQAFDIIHAPFAATHHATRGHHVRVEGDHATSLSYVHGVFIREVSHGDHMFEAAGWYDDVLIRTAGGWRISRRMCRSVWWGGNLEVHAAEPGMTAEPAMFSLSAEARAGRIGHLARMGRRQD